MISIIELHKSYRKNKVLNGINLRCQPGEIHGIVGENGAGKTTLFRCISKMEGFEGKVEYDKSNIKNHIGFLTTNPYFLSKITGREYLQLLCNARNIEINSFEEKNIFDLPLGQFADTYSTGMKKKLALTGILLQKNDVFILDEPFSGVDIQSNAIIEEVIMKLKSLGKIVLLSSHTFSSLHDTCDYLHMLHGGVIKKSAPKGEFYTIQELMKRSGIASKIDNLEL